MLSFLRSLLLGLLLLAGSTACQAGLTSYTDRGKADFDTVLPLLNPYGSWSKIDGQWAFTPLDHEAPYTDGRWIYTEYGWYWKGRLPHSWITEHYGYWKRGADKVWSWYPGPYWLPEIVELRSTSGYIGWRSAAVDRDGNFIEQPADRYAKTDEWTFVTLAQFAGPITPGIVAKPDVTKEQLEESTDSRHTYFTYRQLDRPGPHPADFLALSKDNGGMFAPRTLEDLLAAQPPPPSPIIPGLIPNEPPAPAPATKMTGTNAPALLGQDADPAVDKRKVKYWITMSLPSYWTPRPPDAKPEEIYLYRPDFYQDEDGIARRITLWFNPKARTSLKDILASSHLGGRSDAEPAPETSTTKATPATPALPADSAPSAKPHDPFRSPFDDAYHGSTSHSSGGSSKKPVAPAGSNEDNAPIPPPLLNNTNTTNTPPGGPD